uniref:Uncharacterized protein n=1 Tax=Arundo donax TaxID=35708 RepID=A0A0A8ZE58_ARUDO
MQCSSPHQSSEIPVTGPLTPAQYNAPNQSTNICCV